MLDASARLARFADFEVDLRSGELRRDGVLVPLQQQPFHILVRLLQAPGELVTRQQLRDELWPADTFVDFEHGLNAAIKRLREALADSADTPRFIETLPRRGYRFIAHSTTAAPPTDVRGASRDHRLRLAVLPLANLSGNPQQEYFADGLTESLIAELGRSSALKGVIAHRSVMRYKDSARPIFEIASELNADVVMTGSVMRSKNHVRVAAQLIDGLTGAQTWAGRYERDLKDVFQLQEDISRAIAAEIRVKLAHHEPASVTACRPVNAVAYDAYLMGRFHWFKMTPDGLDRAAEYFQLALDEDPAFTPAHVAVGYLWAIRAHAGLLPSHVAFAKASSAAQRALALDSTLAEAHDLHASVLSWYEWNWEAGEASYRRAIDLNPSYADVRAFYSFLLHALRRPEEARAQIERALELDPHNAFFHRGLGMELTDQRRSDEALVHLHRAAALQPESLFLRLSLWSVFDLRGEYDGAAREAVEYFRLVGAPALGRVFEGQQTGETYSRAMHRAADLLAARSERSAVSGCDVARLYARGADADLAMVWLEKAYQARSTRLPYINVMWEFDTLRSSAPFQALLRRMNLPLAPGRTSVT